MTAASVNFGQTFLMVSEFKALPQFKALNLKCKLYVGRQRPNANASSPPRGVARCPGAECGGIAPGLMVINTSLRDDAKVGWRANPLKEGDEDTHRPVRWLD